MIENSRWTYTVAHEAWYWDATRTRNSGVAEIHIHREALTPEGDHDGVHWEFTITWHDLPGFQAPAPKLGMFNDSWAAFHEIPEFFGRLATMAGKASPPAVVALLVASGFTDVTDRSEGPHMVASRSGE